MKHIALAGLCEYVNYGDQFISKCVEYLVKSIKPDVQVTFISFEKKTTGLRYVITQRLLEYSKKTKYKNWGYKIQYWVIRARFRKYFMEKLSNCDGLIFTCGSFKYTTQYLWAQYSVAIECCEYLDIPVMFDAVDVQRYNASDWRCICLQNHVNRHCVKIITSRDGMCGVERLNNFYLVNNSIESQPAGDPAYWIKECYGIEKKKSEVIGINLIKADNFISYGGTTSAQQVANEYAKLLSLLMKKGIKYELFTNGMPIDEKLAREIEKFLGVKEGGLKVKVPHNDKELVDIISGYRAILGARLHACICAYSMDIPVVGFIWAEKMKHYAEMANIENFFCTEKEFSAEEIYEKLLCAIEYNYDIELKEEWKKQTKSTIAYFMNTF